jgi:hypothetical protein
MGRTSTRGESRKRASSARSFGSRVPAAKAPKQLTEHDAVEIQAVGVCDDIDHIGGTKHERYVGIGVGQKRTYALLPEIGVNLVKCRCVAFERDTFTLTPTPRQGVEVVMTAKRWLDPLIAKSLRDETQHQRVDARVFLRGKSFQLGKRLCVKATDAEVCHDIFLAGKGLSKMLSHALPALQVPVSSDRSLPVCLSVYRLR